MVTRCIIVDDEPLAIKVIEQYAQQLQDLEVLASYQNPIDAIRCLEEQDVDLLILDVEMPILSGLEMIEALAEPPDVIFTTAHREFAPESYELSAIDYLLKPVSFARFLSAFNKFKKQKTVSVIKPSARSDSSEFMFVNENKRHVKVLFKDIRYVESIKDYVRIHTNDSSIVTKERVSAFAEMLPDSFMRIHRSYIVNCDQVTAYTAKDIEIDGKEIPIGESYKQMVKERFRP